MKRIRVTRHIAAPPEAVFDVILDVDRYPEWNPFTPRTTARTDEMAVGKEFDLDCWMTDTRLLEGEREVVLALDRERYHFCMGGTDFENYESFHGPLGPLVYLLFRKRLKRGFEKYCVALEARVLELNRRL
jgi:hypothetical protein